MEPSSSATQATIAHYYNNLRDILATEEIQETFTGDKTIFSVSRYTDEALGISPVPPVSLYASTITRYLLLPCDSAGLPKGSLFTKALGLRAVNTEFIQVWPFAYCLTCQKEERISDNLGWYQLGNYKAIKNAGNTYPIQGPYGDIYIYGLWVCGECAARIKHEHMAQLDIGADGRKKGFLLGELLYRADVAHMKKVEEQAINSLPYHIKWRILSDRRKQKEQAALAVRKVKVDPASRMRETFEVVDGKLVKVVK